MQTDRLMFCFRETNGDFCARTFVGRGCFYFQEHIVREPDLFEFFTPDLEKESACFTLRSSFTHLQAEQGFSTASEERTFDLYKRQLSWEGL